MSDLISDPLRKERLEALPESPSIRQACSDVIAAAIATECTVGDLEIYAPDMLNSLSVFQAIMERASFLDQLALAKKDEKDEANML